MPRESSRTLESIAEQDQLTQPLARLQIETLREASQDVWKHAVSHLAEKPMTGHEPLLHDEQLHVDPEAVSRMLDRLLDVVQSTAVTSDPAGIARIRSLDPLELLTCSLRSDTDRLRSISDESDTEPAIVMVIGQLATVPICAAACRMRFPDRIASDWQADFCPVCGNWPLLAEMRGLDRQHWLRCGRCFASWRTRSQRCVYCGTADHTKLSYLSPEEERESRRATCCESCKSYLKLFATVSASSEAELLVRDLTSIELDIAAMDAGFSQPEKPGYPLVVDVLPAGK